jgi:malate dehydrogenase (oxaloacetate-decarboxylating)
MPSLQALQDRYDRPIVFVMELLLDEPGEGLSAAVSAATACGACVGECETVELVAADGPARVHLTLYTTGDAQLASCREALEALEGVSVEEVLDVAMESHRGGACYVDAPPIESNTDLRIVYTPGVARVCKAIEAEPSLAREYTGIHNTVAIVTNGTAILGLGDIGCVAGMPVMEGKAAIFRSFAEISAVPILVDTRDVQRFVEAVCAIAPTFGAIQVEDVKAPECFPITRELDRRLPIPVMHDDQHGTATIVLAGLYGALKTVDKKMSDLKVAISGAGASATAISELLQAAGAAEIVLCDSRGIVHAGRDDLNDEKRRLAERTNASGLTGGLAEAMAGADLFIGCSQPDLVSVEMVRSMAARPVVFALANPVSEISRADARAGGAAIYADGRMMNNAIAYPGIFRGALDSGCERISLEMMMAAAKTLAEIVPEGELLPEMMDADTHTAVAEAVCRQAEKETT